jgi:hypothetical protein
MKNIMYPNINFDHELFGYLILFSLSNGQLVNMLYDRQIILYVTVYIMMLRVQVTIASLNPYDTSPPQTYMNNIAIGIDNWFDTCSALEM